MAAAKVLCAFAVIVAGAVGLPGKLKQDPPQWGVTYTVGGMLELPYAEIKEPFEGYFDAANKKSRIDYYGGMVETIQRQDLGQYGCGQKIAPMTTYQVKNQKTCFNMSGVAEAPVTVQAILPDLTGFEPMGQEQMMGQNCDKWQMVDQQGNKKNVYTMWVMSSDGSPVRYKMMGYDSLLGSHYDEYYVTYTSFDNKNPISADTFEVPAGMTCGGFPGPGSSEHHVLMNPMKEYIHHHDVHVQEMFQNFKNLYRPTYDTDKEHSQRLHHFRQNVRFIHSKNRQGLGYSLKVNHLADKSSEELKMRNGYRHTSGDHGAKVFDRSQVVPNALPASMDWRLYGAVTPVKDQAVCGSCWSFGTAETIEGAYFLKTGQLVRLSQQELMDCSWGEGNNACDGGEDFRSYNWIMKNGGLTSEEQYGPYLAQDSYCKSDQVKPVAMLKGYVNVTSGDAEALKFAIAYKGPISVAIDAAHKSLSFYANGVYYEPQCGNTPDDLDHAVLAVGYGTLGGEDYWLVKNSWSTYWGNDGYVLMSQKDNNCGVETAATYVEM